MEKLKVGDRVCQIGFRQLSNDKVFVFSVVERLTATRAVLKNGAQLINEPQKNWASKDTISFRIHGENGEYELTTPSIIEAAKAESLRRSALNWFHSLRDEAIMIKCFEAFGPKQTDQV